MANRLGLWLGGKVLYDLLVVLLIGALAVGVGVDGLLLGDVLVVGVFLTVLVKPFDHEGHHFLRLVDQDVDQHLLEDRVHTVQDEVLV